MATTPSVRIVKSMPFKGGVRQFSNRYHMTGGVPTDSTHWHTLFDNIVNAEKLCHHAEVTIVEALGYAPGSDVAVDSKVYSTAGTLTIGVNDYQAPGEVAALIRWSTAARSTKNHPIYLFSYFHKVYPLSGASDADTLGAAQKTAMATYATSWVTGFSDGTVTHKRSSPQGHDATGSLVEEYVTHRDFPYTTSV